MALLKQLYSQKEFYFICSSEEATEVATVFSDGQIPKNIP